MSEDSGLVAQSGRIVTVKYGDRFKLYLLKGDLIGESHPFPEIREGCPEGVTEWEVSLVLADGKVIPELGSIKPLGPPSGDLLDVVETLFAGGSLPS